MVNLTSTLQAPLSSGLSLSGCAAVAPRTPSGGYPRDGTGQRAESPSMKKRDAASDPSLAARGAPFSVEAKNSRHHLRTGATGEAGHHSAPTPDPLGRDRLPPTAIYSKHHSRPDQ